jgi:hypothetical protein
MLDAIEQSPFDAYASAFEAAGRIPATHGPQHAPHWVASA